MTDNACVSNSRARGLANGFSLVGAVRLPEPADPRSRLKEMRPARLPTKGCLPRGPEGSPRANNRRAGTHVLLSVKTHNELRTHNECIGRATPPQKPYRTDRPLPSSTVWGDLRSPSYSSSCSVENSLRGRVCGCGVVAADRAVGGCCWHLRRLLIVSGCIVRKDCRICSTMKQIGKD